MLRLAADENFDGRIVRGLLRLLPDLDLVRVQDTPLAEAEDDVVLEWAAREERVVLEQPEEAFRRITRARGREVPDTDEQRRWVSQLATSAA